MARFAIKATGGGYGTNAHPSESKGEKASQTFIRGAILVPDGSGYVMEGGANPVDILGVAEEAGENNATAGAATVRWVPALPNLRFEGTLSDTALYALVQGDLHKKYGITKDANGVWYIDQTKTGVNARVVIVGFKDVVGTGDARVYFQFLQGSVLHG